MNQPRNIILLVIVGFALVVFAGLNVAVNRVQNPTAPAAADAETHSEDDGHGHGKDSAAGGESALTTLPTDLTLGPADAGTEVVFGWSWTPDVQSNPAQMEQVISTLQKAVPQTTKLRIVNTDAVPDAPQGVHVNGRPVLALPANGLPTAQAVAQAAAAASSSAYGPYGPYGASGASGGPASSPR